MNLPNHTPRRFPQPIQKALTIALDIPVRALVRLAEHPDTYPRPTLELSLPDDISPRFSRAFLHLVAAQIELLSPKRAGWSVSTDMLAANRCVVQIDLVTGERDEVDQALDVLATLASRVGG